MNRSITLSIFFLFCISTLVAETACRPKNKKQSELSRLFIDDNISSHSLKRVHAGALKVEVTKQYIRDIIDASLQDSYIISGRKLHFVDLLDEQQRLAELMHTFGYLMIEPVDIKFKLEGKDKKRDVVIVIDDEVTSTKFRRAIIRKTIVLQNIISHNAIGSGLASKVIGNGKIYFIGNDCIDLEPVRSSFYKEGELFSNEREQKLKTSLSDLKEVSTVDIEYIPVESTGISQADCIVFITTKLFSGR